MVDAKEPFNEAPRGSVSSARRRPGLLVWCAILGLGLCGCTPGPSFRAPPLPTRDRYTARPLTPIEQRLFKGHALPNQRWWQSFGNRSVDRLMMRALNRSPTLESSLATLREAHYALIAAEGIFYPQIGLGLSATREQSSGASFGGTVPGRIFDVYGGDLTVGYYPDVFGANRLVYREKKAEEEVARNEADATALTLEGNVFTTAVDLAESNDEILATRSIVAADRRVLALVRAEYKVGAASRLAVLQQESQLAADEATLYPLLQSRTVAAHALETLTGASPTTGVPHLTLRAFHMPAHFSLAYPSTVIENRPDVRAALETLKEINAKVGEAIAQEYPLVEITGAWGHQSNLIADFLNTASRTWSLVGDLSYTIFSGGTLRAQVHEAKAAYEAAFFQYRGTVLGALGQVADAVRAVGHDASLVRAQDRALRAATRTYRLARAEYRLGATSYLSLLQAEVTYRRAVLADVRAHAQQLTDAATLEIALGGDPFPPETPQPPSFHAVRHE
jgi:NodT family efflux transporter outer membrane factor (OMF) lipoprotein